MEVNWSYQDCMPICPTELRLNSLTHKETLKGLGFESGQEKAMDCPDDNLNSVFKAAKCMLSICSLFSTRL